MPEIREVPLKEYEEMKKSYGFNDEQMKLIMKVAPMKRRWADGNIDEETEQRPAKPKTRQEQIAPQIPRRHRKRRWKLFQHLMFHRLMYRKIVQ